MWIMAIIEVKNLTKKFGDFLAVDNISFEVSEGELFAFLGPNGAGKSTTIKMMTTILKPTSGSVAIDGHDTVKNSDRARQSFGIVFQDQSLDDELTARENMDFHGVLYNIPSAIQGGRAKQLLEFVELWDRRADLVKKFSGGMKRRLEIARGLMHHPKVFFLDEPTLGLDAQTRQHMWSYLKNLNRTEGTTVFLTTHYIEEAEQIAQRVAVIDCGKIVAIGTVEELRQETGTDSLEKAFLKLTGSHIREESAGDIAARRMRLFHGSKKN
jgi:ABC-2 type transport system ATP-binding protein